MRTKVPLRELTELDVTWVSLVDRGANRIPFRIIKTDPTKEPQMGINLSKLGLRKADPVATAISAVVLSAGNPELVAEVRKSLSEAGVTLSKDKTFEDGTVALFEDANFGDTGTVFRLNDSAAVVIKGFEPYGEDMSKLSFGEQASTRGYYDHVRGALNVFSDMVSTALYKSDDPSKAADEVQRVVNEFGQYVVTMTKSLPRAVFKFEDPVTAAVLKFEDAAKLKKSEDEAAAAKALADAEALKNVPATDPPAPEPTTKAEFKTCADCKTADACMKAGKCAGAKVEKSEVEKSLGDVLQAVVGLSETMKTVGTQVATLAQKVDTIESVQKTSEQKLAEVAKKAETANHVLKTTVVGSETSGDPEPQAPVRKSDGDPRTGLFDSAFIRNNRR